VSLRLFLFLIPLSYLRGLFSFASLDRVGFVVAVAAVVVVVVVVVPGSLLGFPRAPD